MSYLPKLFTTGAIRETPRRIIERIADEVALPHPGPVTLVEAGAGMGEITEAILQKKGAADRLAYYAFEIDEEACAHLREQHPQVKVLGDSVFDFEQSIPEGVEVDYFISSIPLSFYKNDVIEPFLEKVKSRLKQGGKLVILFSAAWLLPVFKKHLPELKFEAFLTFPPYFLVVWEKT